MKNFHDRFLLGKTGFQKDEIGITLPIKHFFTLQLNRTSLKPPWYLSI